MAGEKKDAAFFKALPYTRRVSVLEEEADGVYYLAEIVELPGVEGDGKDPYEALFHLQEAFEDYVSAMLNWEKEIPEPELWPGVEVGTPARGRKKAPEPMEVNFGHFEIGSENLGEWETPALLHTG